MVGKNKSRYKVVNYLFLSLKQQKTNVQKIKSFSSFLFPGGVSRRSAIAHNVQIVEYGGQMVERELTTVGNYKGRMGRERGKSDDRREMLKNSEKWTFFSMVSLGHQKTKIIQNQAHKKLKNRLAKICASSHWWTANSLYRTNIQSDGLKFECTILMERL